VCGTPFFPRVLVHLVGLDRLVIQRQWVGGLQRLVLKPVAELQQVLAVPVQFAGQPRGGLALGDPPEDQQDLGRPPVGLVEGSAGKGVEHPAAGVTAVVEDRGAVPPVSLQAAAGLTARAGQSVGVEDVDELLVAGVLVHKLGDGEVHGGLRCSDPGRDPNPPSLHRQDRRLG
jgi:hypothetical protein